MPLLTAVLFTDQAEVDGYNNDLNHGIEIAAFDYEGQPAYLKISLDRILMIADHGLSQAQVDAINALPQTQISFPEVEEQVSNLGSVVQELYVLDDIVVKFFGVLSNGQEPLDSNSLVPAISPAVVGCIGITFSNAIDGSSQDFEFYVDGNLVYTWSITDARYGHITAPNNAPLFMLNVGSRLHIQVNNVGVTPGQDACLTCYFGLAAPAPVGETLHSTF